MTPPGEPTRLFEAVRRFKQLDLIESLGLIPQSELAVLHTVLELTGDGGRRAAVVSEIARRLDVSPPAISRTIRHLRRKGYVQCVPGEDDRRTTAIVVTRAGREALHDDFGRINAFTRRVLTHLAPGELDTFYRLFDKILDGMREELGAAASPPLNAAERDDAPHV